MQAIIDRRLALLAGWLLAAVGAVHAQQYADPPSRVARLSDSSGSVSYSPAGEDNWLRVSRNRPLISGDRVWTDRRSRAELQFGGTALRLDQQTSLTILNLDDRIAQVEINQGTVNLRVRRLFDGQEYEIATPTLAFVVDRPGRYRVDVDPDDGTTTVVVWEGDAMAYGEGANFPLRDGDAVTFYDASLRDYEIYDLPRIDAFDRYSLTRDERLDRSPSLRYVSDDMIGYADLDEYGSWSSSSDYGNVWYPRDVASDWVPYRDGHWAWQEPWGWTWVDDAPWGFAPSHYGRWAWISGRWGWTPGPRNQRSVYAPALVAFVGGNNWNLSISSGGGSRGGAPIGWFPLGPRDVYVPSYRASRDYFNRVNVSNTTININNYGGVYTSYASGRANLSQVRYANRGIAGAITAVPGNVFTGAQPVRQSILNVDRNASARSELMSMARLSPSQNSVTGRAPAAAAQPNRAVFDRNVIARTAPQTRMQSFANRQQQLQADPGIAPRQTLPTQANRGRVERGGTVSGVRVIGPQAGAENTRQAEAARGAGNREERKPLDRSVNDRAGREVKPAAPNQPTPTQPTPVVQPARPQPQLSTRQQQLERARIAREQQQNAGRPQNDAAQRNADAQETDRRNEAQRQAGERQQRAQADQQRAQAEQQRVQAEQQAARDQEAVRQQREAEKDQQAQASRRQLTEQRAAERTQQMEAERAAAAQQREQAQQQAAQQQAAAQQAAQQQAAQQAAQQQAEQQARQQRDAERRPVRERQTEQRQQPAPEVQPDAEESSPRGGRARRERDDKDEKDNRDEQQA